MDAIKKRRQREKARFHHKLAQEFAKLKGNQRSPINFVASKVKPILLSAIEATRGLPIERKILPRSLIFKWTDQSKDETIPLIR